jgi:hypothetical protein
MVDAIVPFSDVFIMVPLHAKRKKSKEKQTVGMCRRIIGSRDPIMCRHIPLAAVGGSHAHNKTFWNFGQLCFVAQTRDAQTNLLPLLATENLLALFRLAVRVLECVGT